MSPQNPGKPHFPNSTNKHLTSQKQRHNQGTIKYLLLLNCLVISITNIHAASAHSVKIAADVGGTLHIEPNDNPRAGEPTQAWFALTRKGGRVIPLAQCNCQLAVYAQPYAPGEPPLLEPSLNPVAAERYQGIPGAEIVFPKPGIYQLQLNGKPVSGASFKPFKFQFEVTVAAGTSNSSQDLQDVNSGVTQSESRQLPLLAIALPILGFVGILFVVLQSMRGRRE
ncbi:hypothetical protein [aff. Roholtiella sp. LEGE 12411]|uniref:hypothetical protein n=1 Tax=aff. Roholtiella sp. LEGE 12411 TaxID=1828822 RepID=UPI001FC8E110|nr:hypothetical protein [aff. Roholtiella sp. LEGE 12411]